MKYNKKQIDLLLKIDELGLISELVNCYLIDEYDLENNDLPVTKILELQNAASNDIDLMNEIFATYCTTRELHAIKKMLEKGRL